MSTTAIKRDMTSETMENFLIALAILTSNDLTRRRWHELQDAGLITFIGPGNRLSDRQAG